MYTVLLFMIGFGVMHGMLGILLGIGDIGLVGGTLITVGHMTGIGVIVMLFTIAIIIAHSDMHVLRTGAIMSCAQV